jgi:uncharacterized membrane protein YeaQ/YmgE (transglycosylase-associated protein family)
LGGIAWIVLGLAGLIADKIMHSSHGIVRTLIGIAGALLGGWVASRVFHMTDLPRQWATGDRRHQVSPTGHSMPGPLGGRGERVIAPGGWLVFAPFLFEGMDMAMLDIRRRISRRRRFTTRGRTGGRACGSGHARVSSPERGAGLR